MVTLMSFNGLLQVVGSNENEDLVVESKYWMRIAMGRGNVEVAQILHHSFSSKWRNDGPLNLEIQVFNQTWSQITH